MPKVSPQSCKENPSLLPPIVYVLHLQQEHAPHLRPPNLAASSVSTGDRITQSSWGGFTTNQPKCGGGGTAECS